MASEERRSHLFSRGSAWSSIPDVKARRAIALFLFAAGCFGLGLVAARWLGFLEPPPAPYALPPGLPPPTGTEPRIYIDASAIELYDGSLTINPPPPPDVGPR